ncbi:double-strand break repair helicase AddA [Phreatobacter sp.]|uniref:double-strand break repair helicase AddA n=1 Tax=Phreatobacter sp. TaxID=1966341 RepID=UPI003F71285E
MSARLIPPPPAVEAQRKASDPALSAWVAANAGSGKTYVLARRVIRLMLAGTPPGAILCLTFTKAAAATMANRVFDILAAWTRLDDAALTRELADLDGKAPSPQRLVRARRLFAEALETPGGLKVQTIHAFCERLLHQFPFEANVASQFTVLDEAGHARLVERAKLAVLLAAGRDPDGPLGMALSHLSALEADQTIDTLLGEALRGRADILRQVEVDGSLEAALGRLSDMLGVRPGESSGALTREIVGGSAIPPSEWPAVAAELEHLSSAAREKTIAGLLRRAAADPDHAPALYRSIFFTAKDTKVERLITKAVRDGNPGLANRLDAEQDRLVALDARLRPVVLFENTAALMRLAHAMVERVEADKAARGALDFDDLIDRTRALLAEDRARWVLYKIDQGIDHILVDEAQDTSPAQWELVSALAEEFTAGAGARAVPRTLFVVGDEKQSIYSFQGADPRWFERMRTQFAAAFRKAGQPFHQDIRLTFSFRSTAAVLSAVDRVFEDSENRRGLSAEGVPVALHDAARREAPGLVELWPAVEPLDEEEETAWREPLDRPGASAPAQRLAARIAGHARAWLDRRMHLPDKARPIRAGDVLILVRRRGGLFDAIIAALKAANVPVAGADRLVLGEHIAVMDLMALGDCLLTPDDDLSLAAVLKSPLVGLDEETLFALAHDREGSLWDAVQASGRLEAALLARWREEAHTLSPAGFYARVLSRDRGRLRMLERLGSEAADPLDEFLSLALAYEQGNIPTLRGFLAHTRAGAIEVKRDMDLARDEVRVMTVHGAKGLEADIVILADTMGAPGGRHDPKLFRITPPNSPAGAPARLVWSSSKRTDDTLVEAARLEGRARQEEEYRRLLYVAMTRAADRLIICGARPKKGARNVWYDMIADQLGPGAVEEAADDGEGTVLRWRGPHAHLAAAPAAPETGVGPSERQGLPGWLTRDAPQPVRPPRLLSPSALADADRPAAAGLAQARQSALVRGTLVHRLLQSLPDLPPEARPAAMARFLDSRPEAVDLRGAIGTAVMTILEDPALAPLFSGTGRAEVSVAGRLGGRAISGQIDRLVVLPDRIIVADYKTNASPPASPEAVPESYVAQMAAYRALVARIHPGRPVEAWLVWTAAPSVMVLAEDRLDRALDAALGTGWAGS